MVSAFGARWRWRRFGPGFGAERDGFIARETYTADEWRDYQTHALRELITLAASRIPYYQRAWRGLGLTGSSIARFELGDLAALPILEKDAPRAEPEAFCVDGVPPRGAVISSD